VLASDEIHKSCAAIADDIERNRTATVAEILKCIATHVYCIRSLSLTGFDVQVKQIVRTYIEYVELLALVCADQEALDRFISSAVADSANSFWHQYLSKSKARKKRLFSSVLKKGLPLETQEESRIWHDEQMRQLSESAHPTFNATILSGRVFGEACIMPPDFDAVAGSLIYAFTSFADMLEVPTIQYLESKLVSDTNERGKEICNRFYLIITAAIMLGYRKDYLFGNESRIDQDLDVAIRNAETLSS
jgi:hypothetical protein